MISPAKSEVISVTTKSEVQNVTPVPEKSPARGWQLSLKMAALRQQHHYADCQRGLSGEPDGCDGSE